MEEYEVIYCLEWNCFELEKNGMIVFVEYEVEDGVLDIMYIIVFFFLEGKGIVVVLVEVIYKYVFVQGLKFKVMCLYVVVWLKWYLVE